MNLIDNARNEIDVIIQRLYELDPFWLRCNPCSRKGYCCEGANPNFSSQEAQEIIMKNEFSDTEKRQLKSNLFWNKKCPFRFPDKCLIHNDRPMNCRWTPYYVAVDNSGIVRYFKINSSCQYEGVEISKNELDFNVFEEHYIWLPHFDGTLHCHILLNSLDFIKNGYDWDIPATEVCKQILQSIKA